MSRRRKKVAQSDNWEYENRFVGNMLGYPKCCIDKFISQSPQSMQYSIPTNEDRARFKAAYLHDCYTGFIPCIEHAKQILSGKITLDSLIENRSTKIKPFPHASND